MLFVTDEKALEYLKSFPQQKKVDLKELYPGSNGDAIDFLNKTLQFHPTKRSSVDELLAHPYLKDVRSKEREVVENKNTIVLDFEHEELDKNRLRELFLKEIQLYN